MDEADFLLDGFVEVDAGRATVALDAIDTRQKRTAWSERFRGQLDDPQVLRRQIAAAIARVFDQTITSSGINAAPRNPAATSAYLRLLHLGNHGQLHEILHWTERTLALDPDWHAGRARLSLRLLQRFFWYGDPQDLARAQVELKRAIDGGGETLAYPRPLPQAYGHGDFATAEPVFA